MPSLTIFGSPASARSSHARTVRFGGDTESSARRLNAANLEQSIRETLAHPHGLSMDQRINLAALLLREEARHDVG